MTLSQSTKESSMMTGWTLVIGCFFKHSGVKLLLIPCKRIKSLWNLDSGILDCSGEKYSSHSGDFLPDEIEKHFGDFSHFAAWVDVSLSFQKKSLICHFGNILVPKYVRIFGIRGQKKMQKKPKVEKKKIKTNTKYYGP